MIELATTEKEGLSAVSDGDSDIGDEVVDLMLSFFSSAYGLLSGALALFGETFILANAWPLAGEEFILAIDIGLPFMRETLRLLLNDFYILG